MPGLTASAFVEYLPRTHGRIRTPRTAVRRAPPLVLVAEKGRRQRDRVRGGAGNHGRRRRTRRDARVVEVLPRPGARPTDPRSTDVRPRKMYVNPALPHP